MEVNSVITDQNRIILKSRVLVPRRKLTRLTKHILSKSISFYQFIIIISVLLPHVLLHLYTLSTMSHYLVTLLAPVVLVMDLSDRLAVLVDIVTVLGVESWHLVQVTVVRACF